MSPQVLEEVLATLEPIESDKLLVKPGAMDDAGAYELDGDNVVVQSVDYFTPVVDDAYDFGWISAVNSLSDIYAMGARPKLAMSVVGFPSAGLDPGVLTDILRGGQDVMRSAGVLPMGGHTIKSPELFYGLSVTGFCGKDELKKNNTAGAGDYLVLTKPVGTGAFTTGMKQDLIGEAELADSISIMKHLNSAGAEASRKNHASAITDISGFGLLGHLYEMIKNTGLSLELGFDGIPFVPGALELIRKGAVPGGMKSNLGYAEAFIKQEDEFELPELLLLADPQTSGGLAIAVSEENLEPLLADLSSEPAHHVIGRFESDAEEKLIIRRGKVK